MMLVRSGKVRGKLEATLLGRARSTWMPLAPQLGLLLLSSCEPGDDGAASTPDWLRGQQLAGGGPTVRWKCYVGLDRLGQSLWRKTAALLQSLSDEFPQREFYLKMDSDAMMFPRPLLRFFEYLRSNSPLDAPLYFGNNRISQRAKFCSAPHCLLRSPAWLELTRNESSVIDQAAATARQHEAPSYAQGGFYGFNRVALSALTRGRCLEGVAAAVAAYKPGLHLFEDEAVGLCMHLRRVPLLTCSCFYDWGPCDIRQPSSCRADTNKTQICRLPLSVHKLKQVSWYDGWWSFIDGREQAALAALDHWQAHTAMQHGGAEENMRRRQRRRSGGHRLRVLREEGSRAAETAHLRLHPHVRLRGSDSDRSHAASSQEGFALIGETRSCAARVAAQLTPDLSPALPLADLGPTRSGLYVRPRTSDHQVVAQVAHEYPSLVKAVLQSGLPVRAVLDAGANAGYSTQALATGLPGSYVVALEPEADNYAMLRLNTRGLPNTLPLRAALWAPGATHVQLYNGTNTHTARQWQFRTLPLAAEADTVGGGSWAARRGQQCAGGCAAGAAVPSVPVPTLLAQLCLPRFDLVKMDVEGAEGTIFAAGGGELQWLNGVRFLYFEAHEGMAPGSEARTLAALLSHNMTVLAAPDERVSDHIYFACGRRSVADALCTATCMQWRASSRALQGMCAAVTDAATAGATYSSVWRRRVGRRRAQGERNR